MLWLATQTESGLKQLAELHGLSIQALLDEYIEESRAELEAIKRADKSYLHYQQTGEHMTHEQMKANELDSEIYCSSSETTQETRQNPAPTYL